MLTDQIKTVGIRRGGVLFVHSSIKAIGADVRAEDLIAALRLAVGKNGTLVFPTFTSREEAYFDPDTTPSVLGIVTEVFRSMPDTLRSRHPYHPVAAQGPAAKQLLQDHEKAPGPCGRDTPFEKLVQMKGQVIHIGCDLDTLTLLHTAEALLDLPYLREFERKFCDVDGQVRSLAMKQTPGGHRGGVRLFESVFRQRGLVLDGRLGNARTMIMDAGPVVDTMMDIMRSNPLAALCPGDYCADCATYKAKVRSTQLAELGAELTVVVPEMPEDTVAFRELLDRFGAPAVFGPSSALPIVRLAPGEKPAAPPDESGTWVLQPAPQDIIKYKKPPAGYAGLAYAPLEAARIGMDPFADVIYKGPCRDAITDIFIEDGISLLPGALYSPLKYIDHLDQSEYIPLGMGNTQLRDIVSALRMRNFAGRYHLVVNRGNLYANTHRRLLEFWNLLP